MRKAIRIYGEIPRKSLRPRYQRATQNGRRSRVITQLQRGTSRLSEQTGARGDLFRRIKEERRGGDFQRNQEPSRSESLTHAIVILVRRQKANQSCCNDFR